MEIIIVSLQSHSRTSSNLNYCISCEEVRTNAHPLDHLYDQQLMDLNFLYRCVSRVDGTGSEMASSDNWNWSRRTV